MPIARELRHLYRTPSWRALLEHLRVRSGNRCEWCGKPNGQAIATRSGRGRMFWRAIGCGLTWYNETGAVVPFSSLEWGELRSRNLRHVTVVCCGAHLNHKAGDDRPENAAFLCQWCHLHQDRLHHKYTRMRNKDARRELVPLLFPEASA